MKYVMAFGNGDGRPHRIEDGSTRESVAEDCREAAVAFMSGVAAGWDKRDLALWLTGPYARATRHGKHGERVAALSEGLVLDESIEALVTHVRGQMIASLESAAFDHGSLEFADEIVERGLVRKVEDSDGRDAWIPVNGARVRLRDRLRSLFVADYLNAPYAYGELFVCHRCEAVVFDAGAKRTGICGSHQISGIVRAHEANDAPDANDAPGSSDTGTDD